MDCRKVQVEMTPPILLKKTPVPSAAARAVSETTLAEIWPCCRDAWVNRATPTEIA